MGAHTGARLGARLGAHTGARLGAHKGALQGRPHGRPLGRPYLGEHFQGLVRPLPLSPTQRAPMVLGCIVWCSLLGEESYGVSVSRAALQLRRRQDCISHSDSGVECMWIWVVEGQCWAVQGLGLAQWAAASFLEALLLNRDSKNKGLNKGLARR